MQKDDKDHLLIDQVKIRRFKNMNKRVTKIANEFLDASGLMVNTFLQSEMDSIPMILIQEIHYSFKESLVYCMREEVKFSMCMIRIATEQTRDLLRILEDESRINIYMNAKSNDKEIRKEFRNIFRFNLESEQELFNAYNVTSDFGVHARIPIFDEVGRITEDNVDGYTELKQKDVSKGSFLYSMGLFSLAQSALMTKTKPYVVKDSNGYRTGIQWRKKWESTITGYGLYLKNRQ